MAIKIKSIPILKEDVATNFIQMADANFNAYLHKMKDNKGITKGTEPKNDLNRVING